MMAMIGDKDRPHYAHPPFWAPFVSSEKVAAVLRRFRRNRVGQR